MAWYAVRCNIKCEHKAEREIRHAGFEVYLPEYKVESFNRRKRKVIVNTLCLFSRYLFVRVDYEGQLGIVRGCNGVEDILPGRPRQAEPVRASDVLSLRQAQVEMRLDDTTAARRSRGETTRNTLAALRRRLKNQRVRITDGPFASFPGTVDEIQSLDRLRVLIQIFGRDTPVDLEMGQFEELAGAA